MKIPKVDRSCFNCNHRTWKPREEPGHAYCEKHKKHLNYKKDLSKTKCEDHE